MKNFIATTLMAFVPLISLSANASTDLLKNEITIRPLRAGISVQSGVLGTEVGFQVDGKQVTSKVIYLTGNAAQIAVNGANAALKEAGEATRYTIDTSRQMIAISGRTAANMVDQFAAKGLKLAHTSSTLAVQGTKAVVYETKELSAVTMAYTKLALVNAVTFSKEGFARSMAVVKTVQTETVETVKDASIVTYKALRFASDTSKDIALDMANATLAASKASMLFVNDAGLFVYDHSKQAVIQLGHWSVDGLKLAKSGIVMTLQTASLLQASALKSIQFVYQALPKVGIQISL